MLEKIPSSEEQSSPCFPSGVLRATVGFFKSAPFLGKQSPFPTGMFASQTRMAQRRYHQTVYDGGLSFVVC